MCEHLKSIQLSIQLSKLAFDREQVLRSCSSAIDCRLELIHSPAHALRRRGRGGGHGIGVIGLTATDYDRWSLTSNFSCKSSSVAILWVDTVDILRPIGGGSDDAIGVLCGVEFRPGPNVPAAAPRPAGMAQSERTRFGFLKRSPSWLHCGSQFERVAAM